jgi:putative glutamine amidotransferase
MSLIGLTTYTQKNKYGYPISALMQAYINAISDAGGTPLLLPILGSQGLLAEMVVKLDGFVFTGGGDISPDFYEAENHSSLDSIDVVRDAMELYLVKAVMRAKKPILGICRGMQVLNIALGGRLYTHIPDQHPGAIKHNYNSGNEREVLAHTVQIVSGTHLEKIVKSGVYEVNSLHHQGISHLGKGLIACAMAPDRLVEAIEYPELPFAIAVQWHPEWLTGRAETKLLFNAFIDAASH